MLVSHKVALLALAQCYDTPEDGVYVDPAYYCPVHGRSSPLMEPRRYVERALYIGTGATSTQPQLAIVEFLLQGHYLKRVSRMRTCHQLNRDIVTKWMQRYFPPAETRIASRRGILL
ncbi:MAG: hypothetical protein GPOALKHO_001166 [Sodalis sp.]|nr:MAG: hypothetical protein GPOALKHO_001166 [Sodalis sp.]